MCNGALGHAHVALAVKCDNFVPHSDEECGDRAATLWEMALRPFAEAYVFGEKFALPGLKKGCADIHARCIAEGRDPPRGVPIIWAYRMYLRTGKQFQSGSVARHELHRAMKAVEEHNVDRVLLSSLAVDVLEALDNALQLAKHHRNQCFAIENLVDTALDHLARIAWNAVEPDLRNWTKNEQDFMTLKLRQIRQGIHELATTTQPEKIKASAVDKIEKHVGAEYTAAALSCLKLYMKENNPLQQQMRDGTHVGFRTVVVADADNGQERHITVPFTKEQLQYALQQLRRELYNHDRQQRLSRSRETPPRALGANRPGALPGPDTFHRSIDQSGVHSELVPKNVTSNPSLLRSNTRQPATNTKSNVFSSDYAARRLANPFAKRPLSPGPRPAQPAGMEAILTSQATEPTSRLKESRPLNPRPSLPTSRSLRL